MALNLFIYSKYICVIFIFELNQRVLVKYTIVSYYFKKCVATIIRFKEYYYGYDFRLNRCKKKYLIVKMVLFFAKRKPFSMNSKRIPALALV